MILKIITKTIANRLKSYMPNIINENQSAIVHNGCITDNVLIAFETFHYMKNENMWKEMGHGFESGYDQGL